MHLRVTRGGVQVTGHACAETSDIPDIPPPSNLGGHSSGNGRHVFYDHNALAGAGLDKSGTSVAPLLSKPAPVNVARKTTEMVRAMARTRW